MTHATVLVILSAGRTEYMRPDTMPFLHGLAAGHSSGTLAPLPGRASDHVLLSGRHPDAADRFAPYRFDPEGSPYRWVRDLALFDDLLSPRSGPSATRSLLGSLTGWTQGRTTTDPGRIPPRYLPFFRPVAPAGAGSGVETVLDLCARHDVPYHDLTPMEDDDEVHDVLVRALRSDREATFFVARLRAFDEVGHRDGPFADTMRDTARRLDRLVASIHAALGAGGDTWDLVVCADHGMAPVHHRVDLLDALQDVDAVPGQDYVVLVDSAYALVWYLNDHGRAMLEPALRDLPGCRLVDDEERRAHHLPEGRQWGDRLVTAEPGVLFWPDHLHAPGARRKGAHGHLDITLEGGGMAVLASNRGERWPKDLGTRPLVDVFPTLCALLGLPVPVGVEGKSLLRRLEADLLLER